MPERSARESRAAAGRACFGDTRWSLVLASADPDGAGFRAALDELARGYREPIRAWFRAFLGGAEEDAEDLTQTFLTRWVESGTGSVDPDQGSFRAYLRGALRHFALNHLRRERALRRAGGRPGGALDEVAYAAGDASPERAFDEAWRQDLLARAVRAMGAEYDGEGRVEYALAFRRYYLASPGERATHAAVAAELGITPSALNGRLAHARARLRRHLERLVRDSVRDEDALARELDALLEPGP